MTNQTKLILLTGGFIIALATANIISVKLIHIAGVTLPAGIIAYPLTFLFTDAIAEVWGKKTARTVVWIGFGANLLMVLLIYIGKILPSAPDWAGQSAYETILGGTPAIVGASMLAYLASQHHDVWAFHFWRDKTRTRFLWLRNNASTMVSQAIDTGIFISLASLTVWGLPFSKMVGMMLAQYLAKLAFAAADTPFCYLLTGWVRGKINLKPIGVIGEQKAEV
jgi:hypothetical protein